MRVRNQTSPENPRCQAISDNGTRSGDYQPLELQAVAANPGKVVLGLLHNPAFFRTSKHLGDSVWEIQSGHFARSRIACSAQEPTEGRAR